MPDKKSTAPVSTILHPYGDIVKKHNIYTIIQNATVTPKPKIGFLKRQNDKQGLMEFVEQNKERIENMDEETFDAVRVILSIPKKVLKRKNHTEGDGHNMCRAMKEWIADERNAGIEEGEKRFAKLASILLASKRFDDLNKAVYDEIF